MHVGAICKCFLPGNGLSLPPFLQVAVCTGLGEGTTVRDQESGSSVSHPGISSPSAGMTASSILDNVMGYGASRNPRESGSNP